MLLGQQYFELFNPAECWNKDVSPETFSVSAWQQNTFAASEIPELGYTVTDGNNAVVER